MRKKLPILFCIICTLQFSCNLTRTIEIKDETPPGTIKIANNIFVDQTEIRNIDYLEYIHWTGRVYGSNSIEYIKTLPDTSSWTKLGNYYHPLTINYLRNPAYRNHPVVGVSFAQAIAYSKWRSDRVMEFVLIREGIIKRNPHPVKDSAFTIEKYFSGNYYSIIKPNPDIMLYPDYTLMDSLQYNYIYKYADSLNKFKIFKPRKPNNGFNATQCYCYEKLPNKNDTCKYGTNPTIPVWWNHSSDRNFTIDHLKGNVRELTSKNGLVFGGCFMDSCSVADKLVFFNDSSINCYTGFRNICQSKKYDFH